MRGEGSGQRGVSRVIGIVLLIAMTLLLVSTMFLLFSGFGSPEAASFGSQKAPTVGSVAIDTDQRTAFIQMESVKNNSNELEILVNGNRKRTWTDYEAGNRIPLFCLQAGDQVTVRQKNPDGSSYIVAEKTLESRSACKFDVSNDGNTSTVTPINWRTGDGNVKEFYEYRDPHAHMDPDFVKQNTSYAFFYEIGDEVALVFVHDRPQAHTTGHDGRDHDGLGIDGTKYGDTAGGAVDMRIDGEPEKASWIIKDDGNDFSCDNPSTDVCWSWASKHTDGGALAGGFKGDLSSLKMDIEATWDSNAEDWGCCGWEQGPMEDWQFVTRNDDGELETVNLTKSENVTIEVAD